MASAMTLQHPQQSWPRRCTAFTLLELLVAVSIIALLVALLLPSIGRARDNAKKAKCLVNARSMALAVYMYATDYACTPSSAPTVAIDQSGVEYTSYLNYGIRSITPPTVTVRYDLGTLSPYCSKGKLLLCPSTPPETLPENPFTGTPLTAYSPSLPLQNIAFNNGISVIPPTRIVSPDSSAACAESAGFDTTARLPLATSKSGMMEGSLSLAYCNANSFTDVRLFWGLHAGYGSVGWFDGHATSEKAYLLYSNPGVMRPPLVAKQLMQTYSLGFLTPTQIAPATATYSTLAADPNFDRYYTYERN